MNSLEDSQGETTAKSPAGENVTSESLEESQEESFVEPTPEEKVARDVVSFANHILKGLAGDAHDMAIKTVVMMKFLVAETDWTSIQELLDIIKTYAMHVISKNPTEATVSNVFKRILRIVREEFRRYERKLKLGSTRSTIQPVIPVSDAAVSETNSQGAAENCETLRSTIVDALQELLSDTESSRDLIAAQAPEHIHFGEIILTTGYSTTILEFLKVAAQEREFQVFVSESAPELEGQRLVSSLSDCSVNATLIPDSSVFAMMARVNKVIVGADCILADGGLKACAGTHAMALAAKHYSIPLIACSAIYKLTPRYLHSLEQKDFNKLDSPHSVFDLSMRDLVGKVKTVNPVFDYVPPELVAAFVSNIGGNAPSYVYRLLTELYHKEDSDL